MKYVKRIISVLLSCALLFSAVSVPTLAENNADDTGVVLSVESKNAVPGGQVSVNIAVRNNPGILSATLEISYDDGLTLTNADAGEAFAYLTMRKPGQYDTPCRFMWEGQECKEEDAKDGTILTLTFDVAKDIEKGKALGVNVNVVNGDFYDGNLDYVEVSTESGYVTVLDFKPGDVNGDGKINTTDVVMLRRYILDGGNTEINANAGNVNDDGKINSVDIILIRRFITGGYGVELKTPTSLLCNHTMEKTEAKSATCTDDGNINYWYCTTCKKYFSDEYGNHEISLDSTNIPATGHTVVVDSAVQPTYTETGLTEGAHCSVCGAVLKKQEVIPVLQKESYSITYHISDNDPYLATLIIDNPNPNSYTTEDGLILKDISVAGYNFKGWYTAQTGGEKVTEIPANSTGEKEYYAQWEKVTYNVHFDSPDVPVEDVTYTVDSGRTLTNPSWFGYTFVGWSNDDGFLVSRIEPGTTGNITLRANWTSNRNKATSYESYNRTNVIEDSTNGQFLFVYDIGKIDNVPLSQIEYIGNTQTLKIDKDYEVSNSISSEEANKIAQMVSEATTKSSGWTLSEEWDQVYTSAEETGEKKIKSDTRTDSTGKTVGGKYFVSNSSGGSSYSSNESGGSNAISAKITTDNSKGINASYDTSAETYVAGKLGATNTTEIGASVSVPVKVAKVSGEVKNTTTIGAELGAGRKDNAAAHVDGYSSSYVGTVVTDDSSSYYRSANSQSSTWNSTSGYEKSSLVSQSMEISSAISEEISKKTSYSVSEALGGQNSKTETLSGTDSRSDEYSTTLKYSEGNSTTTKKHISFSSDRPGYYRLVTAGTIHVYGVVGYDVATASYYTYTYNVLDDERHEYLDYSKDNPNFDDCENGLVTFEVPYEVNEYIAGVVGETPGLEYNLNGGVTGFEKTSSFDGTVTIPQYYAVDNQDGTHSAYKVKSFSADTFRGNKDIRTVILPMYITEIPDNAFEGCSNLETVIAYGVTQIGENAFKDCISLKKFSIDNKVTAIGKNAFANVSEIAVNAANSEVADAVIQSGAKKITLSIMGMDDTFDNRKINITDATEYFALLGKGIEYTNLQIESDAGETVLSNMKFVGNDDVVLKMNSGKVTLNRISVTDSPDFALELLADSTDLSLYGTVELSSVHGNTVIGKNVSFKKANASIASEMNVNGNYLICGEIANEKMLSVRNGEIIQVNEDEFNTIIGSMNVTFDPNEGTVSETSKTVKYGHEYGELPVPERENYNFLGWYTEKEEGTKVEQNTVVSEMKNHTLYAKWEWRQYALTFDANGGTVSETTRSLAANQKIGTLPTPDRDYYDFAGWYTEATGGTEVTESDTITEDTTIYAHWTEKEKSDWVKESEVPSDARITDTKWVYTLREYTESPSSTLSGYTKYDTRRTGWGTTQGPVYSDPSNGARNVWSESYVTSSNYKTVYHYFRYSTGRFASGGSDISGTSYGSNYYAYDFDYALTIAGSNGNHARGYKYYYNAANGNTVSGNYITVWQASPFTTQEWVSDNYGTRWYYQEPVYTYYYYRDVSKEAASDPTGEPNVSNVVKYVRYQNK